jgi:ATP-dependent Clp protease ATP-binding subunit ClpA
MARVIQEHIKKPLAEEILFGALKDGGIVRVLVKEEKGEKVLGFEFIKADAPICPRGPDELEGEDFDPEDGGPDGSGGGPVKSAPKPKAKRPLRRPGPRRPGARRGMSSSPVPKVPLGSR